MPRVLSCCLPPHPARAGLAGGRRISLDHPSAGSCAPRWRRPNDKPHGRSAGPEVCVAAALQVWWPKSAGLLVWSVGLPVSPIVREPGWHYQAVGFTRQCQIFGQAAIHHSIFLTMHYPKPALWGLNEWAVLHQTPCYLASAVVYHVMWTVHCCFSPIGCRCVFGKGRATRVGAFQIRDYKPLRSTHPA